MDQAQFKYIIFYTQFLSYLKRVLFIDEMDAIHSSLHCEGDQNQMDVLKSNECESTNYINIIHTVKKFELLQSYIMYDLILSML